MNMKKKLTAIISGVLCLALLMALPFGFSGLADPDTGLNGDSGAWSEFDQSLYDVTVSSSSFKSSNFDWPSSGSVLVRASGTNWSASDFSGITVPAGIVLDIYQYAGGSTDSYKLLVHVDTTDGTPETIGSSSSNSGNSSNSGTVNRPSQAPSNSGNSSTSSKDWGEVEKVFVPGTPSSSYDNYYTDVPSTYWAYHPIMTLTKGGLLSGYGNHVFGPNDSLTKGQVSIIFTRLLGNPMSGTGSSYAPYSDKTTASRAFVAIWYAGALNMGGSTILTAHETSLVNSAGINSGLLYNLSTNGSIGSMWQAVYDNWRAGITAGKSTDYISSIDELPDGDEIRQWITENWEQMASILHITNAAKYDSVYDRTVAECEAAICRAYNLGMFGGVDNQGTFAPYSPMTRAQMAQILYNMGWTYEGVLDY